MTDAETNPCIPGPISVDVDDICIPGDLDIYDDAIYIGSIFNDDFHGTRGIYMPLPNSNIRYRTYYPARHD